MFFSLAKSFDDSESIRSERAREKEILRKAVCHRGQADGFDLIWFGFTLQEMHRSLFMEMENVRCDL